MQNIITYIKTHKKRVGIIAGILIILALIIFRKNSTTTDTLVVHPSRFLNQVSLSGAVVPATSVDLSFQQSGRVSTLNVAVGDTVKKGTLLSSLDIGSLSASLASARAKLIVAQGNQSTSQTNLEKVTAQQNALVANARKVLLSSNLEAVSDDNSDILTPPIVSGSYLSDEEGDYRLSVYASTGDSGASFRVTGLEKNFTGPLNAVQSVALGGRGLYIMFPDPASSYVLSDWTISIPNKRSNNYVANLNAYNSAVATRDQAIAAAKSSLEANQTGQSISGAEVAQAQANVDSIVAQIHERQIVAPFDGVVSKMDATLGETVSANTSLISMMSPGAFQIKSYMPEVNVALVKVGDEAEVTLDAYGESKKFAATVMSIDPGETIRDGVSTYKTTLQFTTPDELIRSGMTANVLITTLDKPDTIVVPVGVIIEKNGHTFVKIMKDDEAVETAVTTGVTTALGQTEIISGLQDGDVIVLNPTS